MSNYLLIIEYNGAGFSGWQKQPRLRTIQGELEKALKKLFGGKLKTVAAGRTDAGVHASGQAVSVKVGKKMEASRLLLALNALLPRDISAKEASVEAADFDARRDAVEKTYTYRVWNSAFRSVWAQDVSWQVKTPLDIALMRRAAKCLVGKHDFSGFAASGGTQEDKTVNLKAIKIFRENEFMIFQFRADRFLYRMARNVAGTLVDAGRKRIKPEKMGEILKSGQRAAAGQTAPAKGLVLEKVAYRS
jgi:tRNA pseudouridine38-40 synthase